MLPALQHPASLAARHLLACCVVALAACGLGCNLHDGVDTSYGRRGGDAHESVAGTSVLAQLFQAAGFQVTGDNKLSPKLDDIDVVVWAPDDFAPPSALAIQHLKQWLSTGQRTLIYIGRDYDAAARYWRLVQPQAPPEQAAEVARRLALAESEFSARRDAVTSEDAEWFRVEAAPTSEPAKDLSGPWSDSIDEAKTEIEVGHYLKAHTSLKKLSTAGLHGGKVLLASGRIPLVTEMDVSARYGSKMILVANGSFLLNLPLANPEHRKLAARLVNACGSSGKVQFLESSAGGPDYNEQKAQKRVSPYPLLTTELLGPILMHMFCAGIVICAWLFPIFGRPRELPEESPSDFGKHVDSLGNLLAATEDVHFARGQLQHYQQIVRQETGRSATGRSLTGGQRNDRKQKPET